MAASRRRVDPDAADYFARIVSAGSSISVDNKAAVDAFVRGCKADGIWTAIKASCLLAGPDSLAGALVPLVGTAPTNSGSFAAGDHSRTTGLVGNGSSKYLNSNRANNADPRDNFHAAVYAHTAATSASGKYPTYIGAGSGSTGESSLARFPLNGYLYARARAATLDNINANGAVTGLIGISRISSSSYSARTNSTTTSYTRNSQSPIAYNLFIFASAFASGGTLPESSTYSNARISFYSIGESLNLALLDARLATYMSSLT
jgi:hypothetical protein